MLGAISNHPKNLFLIFGQQIITYINGCNRLFLVGKGSVALKFGGFLKVGVDEVTVLLDVMVEICNLGCK